MANFWLSHTLVTVIEQHTAAAPVLTDGFNTIAELTYSFFFSTCDFIPCPCSGLLNVTKFNSPHSYVSIMFLNDLSDQGNYLGSWVIRVRDKTHRDLPASD